MIEKGQMPTFAGNSVTKIEKSSNLFIPNPPNDFANVQPYNCPPKNNNNGFIQILPNVFVHGNSNSGYNTHDLIMKTGGQQLL